jgi:hypothetical protein
MVSTSSAAFCPSTKKVASAWCFCNTSTIRAAKGRSGKPSMTIATQLPPAGKVVMTSAGAMPSSSLLFAVAISSLA